MGQEEVLECLEKKSKPTSRKEIAKDLDWNVIKVSHVIKKLLDNGDVEYVEFDRIKSGRLLGMGRPFRRTRFYFLKIVI